MRFLLRTQSVQNPNAVEFRYSFSDVEPQYQPADDINVQDTVDCKTVMDSGHYDDFVGVADVTVW